ncbi:hypothetical protein HYDPIDRAFT_160411 [Hydnomerulius pinastri MD-312]|uniref:Unplaced genomic scaffold scaffold_35, whole genome shotgun sequence n=1 Tax=Hydnomerulius pinastri MD-312 TaxID=994086 RepID=A0A0C9WAW8_9AGAM|nr:hypothetical protein HYDPIDRAFT_160411 [Hydnomerulius pinastri MD-312]
MAYQSQILNEPPSTMSPQDLETLRTIPVGLNDQEKMLFYEELIQHYSDSHPFLLVRIAESYHLCGAYSMALYLYRKVQTILSKLDIVDAILDDTIQQIAMLDDQKVSETLVASEQCKLSRPSPSRHAAYPTFPISIISSDMEAFQPTQISYRLASSSDGT